jgi:transketolase
MKKPCRSLEMRERLAEIFVEMASKDPRYMVLSGDHGYALFDPIRKHHPDQFINVGVAEQAMIGYAAGMAQVGLKPIVYGLASFVPMRVLEQLRLDICFPQHKVLIFGDGAGLVYSTLGTSHQCTEDIAVTSVLPNMTVYSPCDRYELEDCMEEAALKEGPSYIRLGKADRPEVHKERQMSTRPRITHQSQHSKTLLVSTGSFSSPAQVIAKELNLNALSISRIKPLHQDLAEQIKDYDTLIFMEEHNRHGGLYSAGLEFLNQNQLLAHKSIHSIAMNDQFNDKCGSYQYALSEHQLDDESLFARVRDIVS